MFVFDGGTPILKRRTIAARRRNRENARAKIRKTAEKMLLNHLKEKKLEQLAVELKKNDNQNVDVKGKQILVDVDNGTITERKSNDVESYLPVVSRMSDQERLDEMLATSLAAEEQGTLSRTEPSSSMVTNQKVDIDEEEKEENIFPVIDGNLDPAVLASLPPSMQLDLLVQMREALMAENRQKFQKIKKMPKKFSELQIESYLKTVAFRREINEVQKSAAGKGMDGVQTSRIASEANREFIFSSSFTGDKQALIDGKNSTNSQMNCQPLHPSTHKASTSQIKLFSQASIVEHLKRLDDDVNNTSYDKRGRVRESKVKGPDIHMTHDLQRNLDLMNEYEHDNRRKEVLGDSPICGDSCGETTSREDALPALGKSNVKVQSAFEISFSKDDCEKNDDVDDLFSHLVAGSPTSKFPSETPLKDTSDGSDSDIWEDGMLEGKSGSVPNHGAATSLEDVDWEDGTCDVPATNSFCQSENNITVSRGNLEEEEALQEAIRRSLEEFRDEQVEPFSNKIPVMIQKQSNSSFPMCSSPKKLSPSIVGIVEKQDDSAKEDNAFLSMQSSSYILPKGNYDSDLPVLEGAYPNPNTSSDACAVGTGLHKSCVDKVFNEESTFFHLVSNEIHHPNNLQSGSSAGKMKATATEHISSYMDSSLEVPQSTLDKTNKLDAAVEVQQINVPKTDELYQVREEASQTTINSSDEIVSELEMKQATLDEKELAEETELQNSYLDERLSHLRQERDKIGEEQRKLEITAESVSGEMFAECQELLQMFGLPYIIAPMEAEAQCAHMEKVNLVDGVVTDDSDVFLFGARSVFKNIFDDRKYVETYFMKDIESELGLTCQKLIHMALLLGSDYTEGISGIGIVNAIEVLNAFPEDDGLVKFREWVESPDPAIFGKLDPHLRHCSTIKSSKGTNKSKHGNNLDVPQYEDSNLYEGGEQIYVDDISKDKIIFMNEHRNVSKNWHIPPSFPSDSVVSAYTNPQVDESTEPFSWGKPDLSLLRKLLSDKFGWSNQKADELLLPVLKEYSKNETQLHLEAFYTFNERFAKIRSQRIKKAVKGITGSLSSKLTHDFEKKKRNSHRRSEPEEMVHSEKISSKRCRRNDPPVMLSEERHIELLNANQNLQLGRGSGRARGKATRGRGNHGLRRNAKEGKLFNGKISEHLESYSRESGAASSEMHVEIKEPLSTPPPRRSIRQKKCPNYDEEHLNADTAVSSSAGSCHKELLKEVAIENTVIDSGVLAKETQGIKAKNSIPHDMKSGMPIRSNSGSVFGLDEDSLINDSIIHKDSRIVLEKPDLHFTEWITDTTTEHLINGGGFCIEEDESHETLDTDNPIHNSDNLHPSSAASTEHIISSLAEEESSHQKDSILTAMPCLKRKRRKS